MVNLEDYVFNAKKSSCTELQNNLGSKGFLGILFLAPAKAGARYVVLHVAITYLYMVLICARKINYLGIFAQYIAKYQRRIKIRGKN